MKKYIQTFLFCLFFLICNHAKSQNGVGVNTSTPKSYFEDNGSFGKVVTTVTGNTTLDATHSSIVANNGSTAITITLPAANTCAGRIYEIKRNAASTANVTISGTIDGVTNYLLSYANQSVTIFSDGTNWLSRDGSGDNANWKLSGNTGTSSTTNFIGTTDGVDFVTRTNGTERIRVLSGGNVGIGATNPKSLFEINGSFGKKVTLTSNASLALNATHSIILCNNGGNPITLNLPDPTTCAGRMYDIKKDNLSTADVTIARNSTETIDGLASNYVLKSANTSITIFTDGTNWRTINSSNSGGDWAVLGNAGTVAGTNFIGTTDAIDFVTRTNGTERMRVLSGGNIGIGTTNPKSLFEINGSFAKRVTSTSNASLVLNATHSIILCNNGGNPITLTLPDPTTCAGRMYDIKKDNLSTADVTIARNSTETIDGIASNYILRSANTSITIFTDGTNWRTINTSNSGGGWALLGNAGTTAGTNFVGTTDAQDLVFKTNSAEGARLKTSNNFFGIGTTNPTTAKLTVMSDGTGGVTQDDIALVSYNTVPSPSFVFQSSKGSESAPTALADGDDLFVIQGQPRISTGFGALATFIRSDYKGDGTTNLSDLSIGTSATQRVYINSSGYVGINEGNPSVRLHVKESSPSATPANTLPLILQNSVVGNPSNTEVSLRLSPSTSETARGVDISAINNGGNNIDMKISLGGSASPGVPTEKIRITADGEVGIGVTAPAAYLDVDGKSNSSAIRVRGAAETVEITDMFVGANGNFVINNKVGTGTGSYIDLRGNDDQYGVIIRESLGTGNGAYANLYVTDGPSPVSDYLTINVTDPYDVTQGVHITDQGRMGLGLTAPAYKLDVDGDVNISSDNNLIVRGMSMLAKTTSALMNNGQGSYAVWNQTALAGGVASLGHTHFINHRGTGPGGYFWHNTNDMSTFTNMMTLTLYNVNNPSLGIFTQTPNSNLEVNGSFAANVTTTSANITLNDTHHTVIITGGTPTITLPAANSCPKRIYNITNTTGGARTISSYNDLSNTAVTTIPLRTGITIVSDGATWRMIR